MDRVKDEKGREKNEGGGLMRALADRNQAPSQRSQLTPSPFPNYACIAPLALLIWLLSPNQ